MTATHTHPKVNDVVDTEWGRGIVVELSHRRIVVELAETGEFLNIVNGTPGYYRLHVVEEGS